MKGFVYFKHVTLSDELRKSFELGNLLPDELIKLQEKLKNSLSDELIKLQEKLAVKPSYYFMRSPHAVSGMRIKLPEEFFPGFEGQMFNSKWELRWKKQGVGYDVLLLSRIAAAPDLGYTPLSSHGKSINWEICDRNAYLHNIDETQFPKGFIYKGVNGEDIDPKTIPLSQRYFKDSDTETVHFVALTVNSKND